MGMDQAGVSRESDRFLKAGWAEGTSCPARPTGTTGGRDGPHTHVVPTRRQPRRTNKQERGSDVLQLPSIQRRCCANEPRAPPMELRNIVRNTVTRRQ